MFCPKRETKIKLQLRNNLKIFRDGADEDSGVSGQDQGPDPNTGSVDAEPNPDPSEPSRLVLLKDDRTDHIRTEIVLVSPRHGNSITLPWKHNLTLVCDWAAVSGVLFILYKVQM